MKLFSLLTNKYLLAGTCFIVWMVFFDHNDLFSQLERRKELGAIEKNKQFFVKQIAADRKFSTDLQSNAAAVEKYTREKYLMKRDNEDLFLIQSVKKK